MWDGSSDRNKSGVRGLRRQAGVGVDIETDMLEVERNGSELFLLLHDELERGMGGGTRKEDVDGRSSRDGGVMPSSVYSQSIWMK